MSDSTGDQSFSHVKHLREIRDGISKELEHMTAEEAYRWHKSREYKDPTLRRLMSRARPPKPPRSEHETAHALGLVPYPKYRPSGVEWLEDVPEHWEVRRLKYLVSINDDVLPENTDPGLTIQYVDIGNVDHRRGVHSFESVTFGAAPSRARRIVRHGDTIVSTVRTYLQAIAPIRRPASNMIVSTGFAVLRPRLALFSSGFAYHVLNASGFIEDVVARSVGANYPAISANQIGSIPVATPTLSEQRAISRYLDRETAKIDALIARNEVLIERFKEQRTALISRTVTRGLPPDESRKAGIDPHPTLKPSGVEWLGDLPEHWEIAALCRVTADIRSSNVDKHVRSNEIAVKLCNYVDVYYNESIDSQITYVHGSATGRQIGIFQLREGDVLITKDSEAQDDIGVPALVVEHVPDLVAGYHLVLVRPDLQCLYGPYLFRALQSDVASLQFTHCAQGVTRYGMTYPGIRSVRLPIPPLMEQHLIAGYLDRETAKIDKAVTLARQETDLLREYRTRLISDVVTGKVDVRCLAGADVEAV